MMEYGCGVLGFGWMMLIPLALIGIIVYAAIKLIGSSPANKERYDTQNRALDILNYKFANGEISEEEYSRKKNLLKQ